jgi:Leucine-rich repeat (LRR) protein
MELLSGALTRNLCLLDLSGNQITQLPESIDRLEALEVLRM